MNYVQLCQEIVNELGLSGRPTIPSSPWPPTSPGEIVNVARWIRDALLSIDNRWLDWKYLWNKYATFANFPAGIAAGQQTLPAPPGGILVGQWDNNKFRWRQNGVAGALWNQELYWYDRDELLQEFDPDNAVPGPPLAFTINPDNTLYFSAPFDQPYDFLGEFWQAPVPLANPTDTPLMPANYHRIVVCRAAVMYGNREDAPEIISGLEAEMLDIQDKLEANQLERQGLRRSATDHERPRHHRGIGRFLQ